MPSPETCPACGHLAFRITRGRREPDHRFGGSEPDEGFCSYCEFRWAEDVRNPIEKQAARWMQRGEPAMPSPDPVFLAMLKTPEARPVWEKVLRQRNFYFEAIEDIEYADETGLTVTYQHTGGILAMRPHVRPPDLGELWALAKEKAKTEGVVFSLVQEPDGSAGVTTLGAKGMRLYGQNLPPAPAVLSYLVGHPWDAKKGCWR